MNSKPNASHYEPTPFEVRCLVRAGFKRHRSFQLTGEYSRAVKGLECIALKAEKWYCEVWKWNKEGDEYVESFSAPSVKVLLDKVNAKQGKGGK